MSSTDPPPDRFSPDTAMPEVQQPTAGFIVQLFVIPGLIVLVMVLIWLGINLLSQNDTPQECLKKIREGRPDSWQAALNLATLLSSRNDTYRELKSDRVFAAQIASVLTDRVNHADGDHHGVEMRMYLARAIGEFYVADGLGALILAADAAHESNIDVRLSAIEAIALTAYHVRKPVVDDLLGDLAAACNLLAGEIESDRQWFAQLAADAERLKRSASREPELAARLNAIAARVDEAADRLEQIDADGRRDTIARFRMAASTVRDSLDAISKERWAENGELIAVLQDAGQTPDNAFSIVERGVTVFVGSRLRERAAFAMGVIGGPKLLATLAAMTADGASNVRFNAATGLARHGRTEAVDVLVEMLDPDVRQFAEQDEKLRARKRTTIVLNGLQGADQLADANAEASLARLIAAVAPLAETHADYAADVPVAARPLLEKLRNREASLPAQTPP